MAACRPRLTFITGRPEFRRRHLLKDAKSMPAEFSTRSTVALLRSVGGFAITPDAHRHRVGVNHDQLPVNASRVPVRTYAKDGAMRYRDHSDPVYVPNSFGGPRALATR